MMELFQFQEAAAAQIAQRTSDYFDDPIVKRGKDRGKIVPFFQALSALTGSGKTAILASAVSRIASDMQVKPIVLWLSMRNAVVAQSYSNLADGGKYNAMLGAVPVNWLSEYSPEDCAASPTALVYIATVGTFNQQDKEDGTLRIHKSNIDGMESSVWEALRLRLDGDKNRRPLVIVYDEGQNLSDQQVNLLLDLDPDALIPASATLTYPTRMEDELNLLKANGFSDAELVTKVVARDVVASELVKPQLILEGFNSDVETALTEMILSLRQTEKESTSLGLDFRPKAIYVSDTNVKSSEPGVKDDPRLPFKQREAPPILIWRYLTESLDVDPSTIAVYANLENHKDSPLPDEFVLFSGAAGDFDVFQAGDYQHIIFNQRLQEGWDDPTVYFAYIDQVMLSTIRITQVVGRVLRQPGVRHYDSELLNTAHFFVRFDKNEVFSSVIADVQRELGADGDGVKLIVSSGKESKRIVVEPRKDAKVPEAGLDLKAVQVEITKRLESFIDFREDTTNTVGTGSRRLVRHRVGEDSETDEWEELSTSSTASVRWILRREVQRQLAQAVGLIRWDNPKLDAIVGSGSPAHEAVVKLAREIVDDFSKFAHLRQRKPNPYTVRSVLVREQDSIAYKHSIHERYNGLNDGEKLFASALDGYGADWARNVDRVGYGIPLTTPGSTSKFYPDFIIWVDDRVVCVDTKGEHLVDATVHRKMAHIDHGGLAPKLKVKFVSFGEYDDKLQLRGKDGVTVWGLNGTGEIVPRHTSDFGEAVKILATDSE